MKIKLCLSFGIMACLMLLVSHLVKATNLYTEEIKSFYGLVYEAHGIDPLIKNENLKEEIKRSVWMMRKKKNGKRVK